MPKDAKRNKSKKKKNAKSRRSAKSSAKKNKKKDITSHIINPIQDGHISIIDVKLEEPPVVIEYSTTETQTDLEPPTMNDSLPLTELREKLRQMLAFITTRLEDADIDKAFPEKLLYTTMNQSISLIDHYEKEIEVTNKVFINLRLLLEDIRTKICKHVQTMPSIDISEFNKTADRLGRGYEDKIKIASLLELKLEYQRLSRQLVNDQKHLIMSELDSSQAQVIAADAKQAAIETQESYELRKRLEAAAATRKEEAKRLERVTAEDNRKKTMELQQIEQNRLQRLAGPNKPKLAAWSKWNPKAYEIEVLDGLKHEEPLHCYVRMHPNSKDTEFLEMTSFPVVESLFEKKVKPTGNPGTLLARRPSAMLSVPGPQPQASNTSGGPATSAIEVIQQVPTPVMAKPKYIVDEQYVISDIIAITNETKHFKSQVHVALPYYSNRGFQIREAFILSQNESGESWVLLPSQEVTFEQSSTKDVRYVQCQVKQCCRLVVVSRPRKDYLSLDPSTEQSQLKCVSTLDSRISFFSDPKSFKGKKENFTLSIRPVDPMTVAEIKTDYNKFNGLLTSSYLFDMEWSSNIFNMPVTVTVPCPANPVKARHAADLRAAKDAKMNEAQKAPSMSDIARMLNAKPIKNKPRDPVVVRNVAATSEQSDEKETGVANNGASAANGNNAASSSLSRRKADGPTKWYMGQYALDDEDDNDKIFILRRQAVQQKWVVVCSSLVKQTKIDVVEFPLSNPITNFIALRTKFSSESSDAENMAKEIENRLKIKTVVVIMRQKKTEQRECFIQLTNVTRADKFRKTLAMDGFELEPPGSGKEILISEGESIELGIRGNISLNPTTTNKTSLLFASQIHNTMRFSVQPLNSYLQRNYSSFKGFLQLFRVTQVEKPAEEDYGYTTERELLNEVMICIPKTSTHSEEALATRVPVTIVSTTSLTNLTRILSLQKIREIAEQLGDEWKKLAAVLNVRKVRIHALLRRPEVDAKEDMLLTWLKLAPHSKDKLEELVIALSKVGRHDLSDELKHLTKQYEDEVETKPLDD